jgi:hypothetical protein
MRRAAIRGPGRGRAPGVMALLLAAVCSWGAVPRGVVFTPGIDIPRRAILPQLSTFIHEFPHPRVIVHYHPQSGEQFRLEHAQFALDHEAHALELDLQLRNGEVVCNHDGPTPESPRLTEVIDLVLRRKGASPTVYGDDRQFFLVLEPKTGDAGLLDGLFQILGRYEPQFSTAVPSGGAARGITVVITGDSTRKFYERFQNRAEERNRRCVVEGYDYTGQIGNQTPGGVPFQWVALQHDSERGQINRWHRQGFNVRVWDAHGDMVLALASGADGINVDRDEVEALKRLILDQQPRGHSPSLALRGSQALLTWRGESSNNLYVALGQAGPGGLLFPRQIALTYMLEQTPLTLGPAAALTADGRLLVVYEGTASQRLWYVYGFFSSPDRFLTFAGGEHRVTLPDNSRRGHTPSVAIAPDGRVVMVYEGTDAQRLWYVSGYLNGAGEIVGNEFSLTEGNSRRGYTPSIAIDAAGRVLVVYRGTSDEKIWYVSGTLDAAGRIVGREFSLTEGDSRRGYTPSVAIGSDGRVLIAYEGTSGQKLWYVSGYSDGSGRVVGDEFSLTQGDNRRGTHPTAAIDDAGNVFILYEGTSEAKLWYVEGHLDRSGQVLGPERLLDMSMDRR